MPSIVSGHRTFQQSEDWRDPSAYQALLDVDVSIFAWEWLRRTPAYRLAWSQVRSTAREEVLARHFGLERLEDPSRGAPQARPVWSAAYDRRVIGAEVHDIFAPAGERIDLRELAPLISITVDVEGDEHLLISNGNRSIRVDIRSGTLIGCPASLRFELIGLDALAPRIAALNDLLATTRRRALMTTIRLSHQRLRRRWILQLRVADALAVGVRHQEIARVLFADRIPASGWRSYSEPYRLRIQRLARAARQCLAEPLSRRWFDMAVAGGKSQSRRRSRT